MIKILDRNNKYLWNFYLEFVGEANLHRIPLYNTIVFYSNMVQSLISLRTQQDPLVMTIIKYLNQATILLQSKL